MYNILDDIKSKNPDLDSRILEFLNYVIYEIELNDNYSKIILNMLIPQLIIYYKALDVIKTNKEVSHKDDYSRISKSPEIAVMQKANDQILNLLDKLAISPMEKAKIKRINKDDGDSANELLANLMA